MKILVIQTAFFGDTLLCIPLLKRLRVLYPESEIHFLCRKSFKDLFLKFALVERVIGVDKKTKNWKEVKLELKQESYDLLFCPHDSTRSNLLSWEIKAKAKIGFHKSWNRFIFDQRVKRPMQLPDAIRQLSLLCVLDENLSQSFSDFSLLWDSQPKSLGDLQNRVNVPDWASMHLNLAKEKSCLLNTSKPVALMAPGSVWATKKWKTEGFVEVAKYLYEKNYEVYLIGSPDDIDACEKVEEGFSQLENLCGQTSLVALLQVFQNAELLISNDSGPMHLASVVGLKNVSVFGPTTLDLGYRPWQDQALVVEKDVYCRPCGKHGHNKCPKGTHECMLKVEAKDLIEKLEMFA